MPMPQSETVSVKRTMDQVTSDPVKSCLPMKPLDISSQSLASMMASRRSSLQNIHKKFAFDLPHRRVSFGEVPSLKLSMPSCDASAPATEAEEPPMKRRRFQRRNSKTAAMLISSMSSIISKDFGEEENEAGKSASPQSLSEDNNWDGGLEIAEELVRHLKLRRQNNSAA